MELTSKQRAQLRGLANNIDTILIVGKEGIGDNLVQQANEALEARELIKGRVLETSLMSAREAAEALAPGPAARWCRSSAQNLFCTAPATRRT